MSTWTVHEEDPYLVLICGSRHYENRETIERWIRDLYEAYPNLLIVQGGANGADTMAREEAEELGIGVFTCRANWDHYGKAAGPLRNRWMAALGPNLVLGFHENFEESRGTRDMLEVVNDLGLMWVLIAENVTADPKALQI